MKRFYVVLCASLVCAVNAFAQANESKDVACDGSVQITATPKAGFHFVQWNDGSTEATRTIANIKEAKTFTATFAADETTIDPSIDPGVDFPVAHGTTLHLTPHTDDDCQEFDHWSDITDPTDPNYAIVPRDFEYNGVLPTFTAVFKTKIFNVEVNADDATHGDVTVTVIP
ncbi:MAG: hypothetical protein J6M55_04890 [Paludibacteraceae bacterium]|nr:hypothetical protein [Paludibacteraceae bacterium]MBO6306824.1 hypothetical protein [Paludibacteraceae bacterium]